MQTFLDHLVIAANNLEEGADYVNELFGIDIAAGGRHEIMGTHNKVTALGENIYLEVVSVNPDMQVPDQPRWFGLDDPHVLGSLASGPKLLTWAVRTDDLERLVAQSTVPVGRIREASRDDLRWKVAITEDGRMPAAGFVPLCMQWLVDPHPAGRMQDTGCRFRSLTLHHPHGEWLARALQSIGADRLVDVAPAAKTDPARMELVIDTPRGSVTLDNR